MSIQYLRSIIGGGEESISLLTEAEAKALLVTAVDLVSVLAGQIQTLQIVLGETNSNPSADPLSILEYISFDQEAIATLKAALDSGQIPPGLRFAVDQIERSRLEREYKLQIETQEDDTDAWISYDAYIATAIPADGDSDDWEEDESDPDDDLDDDEF